MPNTEYCYPSASLLSTDSFNLFSLTDISTSAALAVFAWVRSWVVFVLFSLTGGQQELSGGVYNGDESSE